MKRVFITTMLFLSITLSSNTFAQEGQTKTGEGGFSGSIMIGGGWEGGKPSQLDVNDDNKRIDDLNKKSDTVSQGLAFISFLLSYEFTSTGTTFFIGNSPESVGGGGIGVSQSMGDIGTLTFTGNYSKDEVWENPYLVGIDREESDTETISFDISHEEIFGTGAHISYTYESIDVDKDIIGQNNSDLQRDGAIHSGSLGYAFNINESNTVIPGISYTLGDLDGESNSFKGYSLDFIHQFQQERYSVQTYVSAERNEFDKTHPIFNKIREEDEYSIISTFTLMEPFGFESFFTTLTAGYTYTDANIEFFESSSTILALGVGYNF